MNSKELMGLAERMVALGKKKGATEIEVTVRQGTEFTVDVIQGEIERLKEATSQSLALRLFVDGKMARATSSDFNAETLERLVANSVQRASLASKDPLAGLPERSAMTTKVSDLNIHDPAIVDLSPEKKIAAAKHVEALCLADKRVKKSFGASFSTYVGEMMLANSNGFSGSYGQTYASNGIYLQAGDDQNLFDEGWNDSSVILDRLESPEVIAKKAIHRVTRLIGGRKVESQNVPVVLESPMTASMLQFFLTCVSGTNVYLKQSFLADKLGESIANDLVTIIDDGLLPGAAGTKPFDGEGVPTRKNTLVEKGVLKSFVLDTYAGRKLGMKSTGNYSGANNLYLAAGNSTPEQIIKSVDKGLLLTGTIGFGLVPTTGDISRGAFGIWIEKGELTYPVSEITISSNLGQLLRGVQMVGNDLEFKDSITAPTIKVAEMTIGGK